MTSLTVLVPSTCDVTKCYHNTHIFLSCRKFLRRSELDNSCHTWWNLIYFPSFNQATKVITPQRFSWFAWLAYINRKRRSYNSCAARRISCVRLRGSQHPHLKTPSILWNQQSSTGLAGVIRLWSNSVYSNRQSLLWVAHHWHWGAAGISAWTTFIRALHSGCTWSCGKSWCWGSAICGRHSGIPALQGEWSYARSHWARKLNRRNQRLDVVEPLETESQQDTVYLDWQ